MWIDVRAVALDTAPVRVEIGPDPNNEDKSSAQDGQNNEFGRHKFLPPDRRRAPAIADRLRNEVRKFIARQSRPPGAGP